jgi:hypothetical protein
MNKKRRTRGGKHSGFSQHSRVGSKLTPPLAKLPVALVDYERDLLPELLWIASLVDGLGVERSHLPYYELANEIDKSWNSENVFLGFISDFGAFPKERRSEFKDEHKDLIQRSFQGPIGRILAFFPDSPAYWLVDQDAISLGGFLDPELELARLRDLVIRLMPGKDDFAGHARALPLGRILKHGRLHVPRDFSLIDVMPRYPSGCTDEEKRSVQSFARMTLNMTYDHNLHYRERTWPKYFWRHNYDLVVCRPARLPIRGSKPLTENDAPSFTQALELNAGFTRDYLAKLTSGTYIDLYSPEKYEILLGLFSRCARLFILMSEDVNLWARDTGGIFLRCLADSSITFCYLAKAGSAEDFECFKSYGEGQEKLLMLHLQDNYPNEVSLEGRSAPVISDELGSFNAELIHIELGSWSKQDTRKLAHKAGLEHLYRLIYAPASSDLHGTWMSLKHSSLTYCAEPLHRFHRLPAFAEPPVYVNAMLAAQSLFETCVSAGIEHLGFPPFQPKLSDVIREIADKAEPSSGND